MAKFPRKSHRRATQNQVNKKSRKQKAESQDSKIQRSQTQTQKILKGLPLKKSVDKSYRNKSQRKGKGGCLIKIFAIALILASGGMAIAFAWFSLLFIFSPDEARVVGDFLPEWARLSGDKNQAPESLKEIEKSLIAQGKILGKKLALGKDKEKYFLLPVFEKRSNCEFDCQYITQLRAYQIAQNKLFNADWQKKYFLSSKLDIVGPLESFAIAPLVRNSNVIQGSNIALPLSEIKQFQGQTPTEGKWFYLQGKRSTGNHAIAYGHIVHYNPQRTHLQVMLSWSSPTGEAPQWKQVTGNEDKELVINQTVGFEPNLRVYQVKPVKSVRNPIVLKPIELKPALFKDSGYEKALLIARSGLWTPAYKWLQFIQKQKNSKISAGARAQIDTIGLHANLSQKQAAISWASPSQQVQVDLINGDWSKALQILDKSPDKAAEVAAFLKRDNGSLWSRVIAALEVNPRRREVQAWGGLILTAEQGEATALSWLKDEAKVSKDNLEYIQGLLKKLKGEVAKPEIILNHPSRIIGEARLLSKVNPQNWLKPSLIPELQIQKNQTWYEIKVSSFHNGKGWLSDSFNSLKSDNLWNILGLNTDPLIQVTAWNSAGEQQSTTAIVKGLRHQGNQIRLLAQVEEKIFPSRQIPLALSSQALEWIEPPTNTLLQLYQQDPVKTKNILSQIWRSLQKSNLKKPLPQIKLEQILQLLGNWSVQEIDLTGNKKPEIIISISKEAIAYLYESLNQKPEFSSQKQNSRSQSLILSDSGNVIYNDFYQNSQQSLIAIAQLLNTERFVLVVENSDKYQIKTWSEKSNRF
ncbi:MAG: hypothetical protein ACFB02_02935 [Mastigocoleus sp.]